MQVFSERLKGRRAKLGWSQQKLADKCNVALRSVQGWEGEGVIPHETTLRNLAEVLDVPVAYLTQENFVPAMREEMPPYRVTDNWQTRALVAEAKLEAIRALLESKNIKKEAPHE